MKVSRSRRSMRVLSAVVVSGAMVGSVGTSAHAAGAPTSAQSAGKPDLVALLSGYKSWWQPSGKNDLQGRVLSPVTFTRDDQLTSWINQHATSGQKFRALQNSLYATPATGGYDQSISIADGLGSTLGKLYAQGRVNGKLPLTSALLNNETGSAGAFVSTSDAKKAFSHPRPFLPAGPKAKPAVGDSADCSPTKVNAGSMVFVRTGMPWADASGNLKITRVPAVMDTTHAFAKSDVKLDAGYGEKGLCTGGSFPSGHTTSAYQAGITLATLMPELAPSILARTSEAGNNRIVLGVHYPLDIIGGRMSGEAAIAARWSDATFRKTVLEPARKELVSYLTTSCTATMHVNSLAACIAKDTPYRNNPYGGAKVPGGSSQIVSNRGSALGVYTERMSYGFTPKTSTRIAPVVPQGAANLLLTTFPTLTDAQRASVLAQTELRSGHPLAMGPGAGWQRINLAAAMSATVVVNPGGSVRVVSAGCAPKVITVKAPAKKAPAKRY